MLLSFGGAILVSVGTSSLVRGEIHVGYTRYQRHEDPFFFWSLIVLYIIFGVLGLLGAINFTWMSVSA